MLAPSQRFPDEPAESVSLHGRTGAASALETPWPSLDLTEQLFGRPAVSVILDNPAGPALDHRDLLRTWPEDAERGITPRRVEGASQCLPPLS